MSGDVIQAKYEDLDGIARRLVQESQAVTAVRSRITRSAKALEQGGWIGRGSTAFFSEMNSVVFPALQRLIQTLEEARAVTVQASAIMRTAEEDAARLFKGEPTNGSSAKGGGNGSASSRQSDNGSWWSRWGEWVHGALDGLGLVPVVGEAADGLNALIYLGEGRHLEAGISAVAMIPLLGDLGKGGKYAFKIGKEVVEEAGEAGAKRLAKEAAEGLTERGARQADEFLRFGELAPNAKYTRNGYEYATDEIGRVNRVSGELKLETAPRTSHQTEVGKLGLPDDEGGHLIGSRFGGTPEGVNIVPQNANLNKGDWKKMENEWARALDTNQKVEVDIQLQYPKGGNGRPSDFTVEYTIDGKPYTKVFRNRPGS